MGQGNHVDHPPVDGGYRGSVDRTGAEDWCEESHMDGVTFFSCGAEQACVERYTGESGKVKGILVTMPDEVIFIPYEIIRKVALLDKYVLLNPEQAGKLGKDFEYDSYT